MLDGVSSGATAGLSSSWQAICQTPSHLGILSAERIREELHHGRTVKSAIDAGFGKALSSVMDANITTLIAALFLFQFGTGPIRGFAVTLSIGILASLFTAIFVSRWIFDVVVSRRRRVDRLSI